MQCLSCSKTFLEPREKPLDEMTVNMDKAMLALKLLVKQRAAVVERICERFPTAITIP